MLNVNFAYDSLYYLCIPIFSLFGSVGIVYAFVLFFRRITKL